MQIIERSATVLILFLLIHPCWSATKRCCQMADPSAGEWPQEPDGFYNIKFGSTKEEAEKVVTFERYGITRDNWGLTPEDPYPTLGVAHFNVGGVRISASLIFHPARGLQCIQGTFPTDQFEAVQSAFLKLYGKPHEVPPPPKAWRFPEEHLKNLPPEERTRLESQYTSLESYNRTKVESLWYSANAYVSLLDRDYEQTNGHFLVASYLYMKHHGGYQMVEIARKKMPCTCDEYTPPGGWTQEPDDFNGLKLDMTKAEAERHVTLGKCTVTTFEAPGFPARDHVGCETTLNVGGLALPGEVLFIEDRLINLGGKFNRSQWDAVRTAFIDRYGRPHVDERQEIFEQGPSRRLEWQGDRVQISLSDFPDGTNFARFWFQRTQKGAKIALAFTMVRPDTATKDTSVAARRGTSVGAESRAGFQPQGRFRTPPPEKAKIGVERTSSALALRLPGGTTLNYSRSDPSHISLKSNWHRRDDGLFVYDLDIDASTLSRITLGDEGTPVFREATSQPDGWLWFWGWVLRRDLPQRMLTEYYSMTGESADASATNQESNPRKFSLTSTMLPGPIPIDLVSHDAEEKVRSGDSRWDIPVTLPSRVYDAVQETLREQTAFLNNTFILGPAIAPNSNEDQLRQLIHLWIDRYGFDFLRPLLVDDPLSSALARLTPRNAFEARIVDCLRAALTL